MPEERDLRTILEAAERAAAAGDHAEAETLLRSAAEQQEATLGPLHPDLANTLNNLGVVCDYGNKPEKAERFYRRAYQIATRSLAPDHPFVATSRQNLVDFCEARGIPVDPTAPRPAPAPVSSVRVSNVPAQPQGADSGEAGPLPLISTSADQGLQEAADDRLVPGSQPPVPGPHPPVPSGRSYRPLAIAAIVAGLVLTILVIARPWFGSGSTPEARVEPPRPTPAPEAAPTPAPAPGTAAKPEPAPKTDAPPAPAPPPVSPDVPSPPAAESPAAAVSSSVVPVLAEVRLCQALSAEARRAGDWSCDPVTSPVPQGRLYFYTRVKADRDTTIQHRWYRGDRLHQSVDLRVGANPRGYRTYSRNTSGPGEWRVEARSRDGTLLHEERFTVQ